MSHGDFDSQDICDAGTKGDDAKVHVKLKSCERLAAIALMEPSVPLSHHRLGLALSYSHIFSHDSPLVRFTSSEREARAGEEWGG